VEQGSILYLTNPKPIWGGRVFNSNTADEIHNQPLDHITFMGGGGGVAINSKSNDQPAFLRIPVLSPRPKLQSVSKLHGLPPCKQKTTTIRTTDDSTSLSGYVPPPIPFCKFLISRGGSVKSLLIFPRCTCERCIGAGAEVGKVTWKSNGDEALNDVFLLKVTAMKCLRLRQQL
jgi:hypothetical protein